jgi:hypothetical protein
MSTAELSIPDFSNPEWVFFVLSFGYPCSTYVRGPYFPEPTRDLYDFRHDFEQLATESHLNAHEKETARDLGRVFGLKPVLLEIGATYGYFSMKEKCSPLEALTRVKRLKPFYSEARIAVGISKAKEFLFEPTANDLEELKKEAGIWQSASLRSMEH